MNGAVLGRTIEAINGKIAERPYDAGAYEDLLSVYKAEMDECGDRGTALYAGDGQVGYVRADADWHEANRGLRDRIVEVTGELVRDGRYREVERFNIAYRRSLLMDARVDFDAYMLYVESDRDPERRFWLPRRGILRPVADEMVRMVDGDLRLLSISLPPGVGKTTLAIFLLTWIGGRWPDEYSVVFSHDGEGRQVRGSEQNNHSVPNLRVREESQILAELLIPLILVRAGLASAAAPIALVNRDECDSVRAGQVGELVGDLFNDGVFLDDVQHVRTYDGDRGSLRAEFGRAVHGGIVDVLRLVVDVEREILCAGRQGGADVVGILSAAIIKDDGRRGRGGEFRKNGGEFDGVDARRG